MIRAWRYWRVGQVPGHAPKLWSLFVSYIWDEPHVRADYPPTLWNEHGIYGFKERGAYFDFVEPLPANYSVLCIAGGWVQLWGKIIEHDSGYRAEHAMIESLRRNSGNRSDLMSALQHHYGCDLI